MFTRCCTVDTLRTVKGFKHIRSKTSNVIFKNMKLTEDTVKFRCEIMCEILKCNTHTAREIIAKNREIGHFNQSSFYQNVNFVNEYFKLSDLVEFPCLLTLQPNLLQHRYFSLKELGFYNVTPSYILKFPFILKEIPQALKLKGYPLTCEYNSDILLEYLVESKRTEVHNKLLCMYKDGSDFLKIREVMNAEFLAVRLQCSIGKAYQMIHKYAALKVQSISNTDQLLKVLFDKYELSYSKIYNCLRLLSAHHKTVELFLSEFPEILGVRTLFLVKRLPILLKQENETIRKIEAVLKDFNISKDQLKCCPKVLLTSPNTLQNRLNILCKSEDFTVLKSNKKFLWLVYYFNNLTPRLKYLKAENMPCSINMLTASKSNFEKNLLYNNTRICIRETYVYLGEVFKLGEGEIFKRLQHCSHIRSEDQNFSTQNCRKVIEFLLLSGVSKEQIFQGLEIVFYDIDTVKIYFNNLKTHPQCQPYQEWSFHSNFIHLLIYTIEVTKYHSYDVETDEQEDLFLEYLN